jgi:hypothetical protein
MDAERDGAGHSKSAATRHARAAVRLKMKLDSLLLLPTMFLF